MKAIFFAFVATVFYTAETVVADNKLSKVSPWAITLWMGVVTLIISAVGLWSTPGGQIVWPKSSQVVWVGVVVIAAFAADLFHFYSLYHKVGAVVLCTSYALMPVFATAAKCEMPSARLVLAWMFAATALFLAYKEIIEK